MSGQDPLVVILERLTSLQQGQLTLQQGQDRLRVELMARMDRLQNAATKQGHDMDVLLDLMATNQRISETATAATRAASDIGASNSSALTKLLQRQRELEADVAAIKERLNGSQRGD